MQNKTKNATSYQLPAKVYQLPATSYQLIALTIFLILFGLFIQFNIATSLGSSFKMLIFQRHLLYVIISSSVAIVLLRINILPQILKKLAVLAVIILLGLLIFMQINGVTYYGATRALNIGKINFQPSQFAHPILIILFAKYFDKRKDDIKNTSIKQFLKQYLPLAAITIPVFFLIYIGKHLSTLIILTLTLLAMFIAAGFKKRIICLMMTILPIVLLLVVNFGADYREGRIQVWKKYNLFTYKNAALYTQANVSTKNPKEYQVNESLKAISQGGLFGTGKNKGMAKHNYLPEVNTDYVFSIIAEQFGFIFATLIIAVYFFIYFRVIKIAQSINDFYKKLLVFGLGTNIFTTALVNIGVAMSLLPSTGVPLPFISYGGTAILVNITMIAMILNIGVKNE